VREKGKIRAQERQTSGKKTGLTQKRRRGVIRVRSDQIRFSRNRPQKRRGKTQQPRGYVEDERSFATRKGGICARVGGILRREKPRAGLLNSGHLAYSRGEKTRAALGKKLLLLRKGWGSLRAIKTRPVLARVGSV